MPPFRIDRIVILRWNYYFFTDNTCQRFQRQRPNDRFPRWFSAWVIQRHIEPDGSGARSIFVIEHRAPFSQSNIEVLAGKRRKTVFQTTVWNWRASKKKYTRFGCQEQAVSSRLVSLSTSGYIIGELDTPHWSTKGRDFALTLCNLIKNKTHEEVWL